MESMAKIPHAALQMLHTNVTETHFAKGVPAIIDTENRENVEGRNEKKTKAAKRTKERYSVTLSKQSEALLEELKDFTDAETVTEVFRDSLRLSYLIMNAQKKGLRVEIHDPADPKSRPALVGVGHSIPG